MPMFLVGVELGSYWFGSFATDAEAEKMIGVFTGGVKLDLNDFCGRGLYCDFGGLDQDSICFVATCSKLGSCLGVKDNFLSRIELALYWLISRGLAWK